MIGFDFGRETPERRTRHQIEFDRLVHISGVESFPNFEVLEESGRTSLSFKSISLEPVSEFLGSGDRRTHGNDLVGEVGVAMVSEFEFDDEGFERVASVRIGNEVKLIEDECLEKTR